MRLRALTLQGLERFDDRICSKFDPAVTATGVTVMIGPNGLGKSNVIGALFIWSCG